jgi:hypothetical protein
VNRARLLGALAIIIALPGVAIDRPVFYAAWLAAWWFWLGVVLGALANASIHRLTGGRWGDVLHPATQRLARAMPWLLVLALPLAAGLDVLYPWAHGDPLRWRDAMAQPQFNVAWLSPGPFALRLVLYGGVWWWLAHVQRRPASRPGTAAAALLVHVAITSLAAVDLLMSLQPPWTSAVFALLVLVGQLLAGSAAAIVLAAASGTDAGWHAMSPSGTPPIGRDLGNLLLTWVLSWAYLAFVQLLIIWAEDLPREIAWYLPRLHTGWHWVGAVLWLSNFALPLLALLMRAVKDSRRALACVAGWLVAANGLDAAWLVVPSVDASSVHAIWLVPLLVLGIGLLLWGDALDARHEPRPTWEMRHADSSS